MAQHQQFPQQAGCVFSSSLSSFTVREKLADMTSFPPISLIFPLFFNKASSWLWHWFLSHLHRLRTRHVETKEQTHGDRKTTRTCRQEDDERMTNACMCVCVQVGCIYPSVLVRLCLCLSKCSAVKKQLQLYVAVWLYNSLFPYESIHPVSVCMCSCLQPVNNTPTSIQWTPVHYDHQSSKRRNWLWKMQSVRGGMLFIQE